ncbi:MAG: hypothetical protein AB8G86_27985 [Saprospiraceae bacterium]
MLQHLINLIKKVVHKTAVVAVSPNPTTPKTATLKGNNTRKKAIVNKTKRINALLGKLYLFANGTQPQNWSPSRFLYKVGVLQLEGITAQLTAIAKNETELLNKDTFRYSLIRALGRCGDETVLPLLDTLIKTDEKDYIKRLTLDVYLKLATKTAKKDLLKAIKVLLPTETIDILTKSELANLSTDQLNILFSSKNNQELTPLFACYLLSTEEKALRPAVLELLKNIPFQYPYFQSIRYIFKSAEFRNDFEVLGILAYRLDVESKSHDTRFTWHWNQQTRQHTRQRRPNQKAAFSNLTKAYFQKRILRNLLLLGEQETTNYCRYAANILTHYKDEQTAYQEESVGRYYYQNGRSNYVRSDYNYYENICFPWITKSAPNDAVKVIWKSSKYRIDAPFFERLTNNRSIPFAELWQKKPAITCQLLQDCQSEDVAEFAVKILQASTQENDFITKEVVLNLLKNPLNTIASYVLKHLVRFFDPKQPDWTIIQALIQAPNRHLRQHLLTTITAYPTVYFKQAKLAQSFALSTQPDLAKWFQENGAQFNLTENKKTIIFEQLLTKIQTLKTASTARFLYLNSQLFFESQMQKYPIEKTAPLLQHALENVQLLGADILLAQKTNIENIPEATILQIMEAPFLSVRCKGMELFGEMPVELLLQKKDILISMAISEAPEMRAAIQPIIAKTAKGKPAWSAQLLQFFVPILLRKETYEGLHEDILELLVKHLGDKLHNLSKPTLWKLIQSHYKEANLLGMELLQYVNFSEASLSDIISLANHEMPTIRQYCLDYFNNNIGRVRYESLEALRLLDVKWADCRQFGFAFFDKHYKAGDWSPELLVSTCDSTRPDVQEFGKKMMVKFFDEGKGEAYLMQLSQHPNVSLQLFATNYLQDFAAGKLPNFIRLKRYFKTVLCGLYKGGTTKKRIFDFMESEALNNKEIASHAVEILNEVALTVAIRDKARCIQALHRIRRAYPELGSVLEIEAPLIG